MARGRFDRCRAIMSRNQKNKANASASHNYILSIDADEALSEGLIQEILNEKTKGFTQGFL